MTAEITALFEENAALRAEVAALRRQVKQLQEQLEETLKRLAELEHRKGKKRAFVKPNRQQSEESKKPRKKRTQEQNTSRKRGEPTRVERHALERCPECNYRLQGESIDYTREVVELPEPQPVEVIEHQVIKRWCPSCQAWQAPHLDLSGKSWGRDGSEWALPVWWPTYGRHCGCQCERSRHTWKHCTTCT